MSYGKNHNRMYSTGLNYAIEDTREKWQKQQALDERISDATILLKSRAKYFRHEFLIQQGENMGKSGGRKKKNCYRRNSDTSRFDPPHIRPWRRVRADMALGVSTWPWPS
jgi:hypothetical protein